MTIFLEVEPFCLGNILIHMCIEKFPKTVHSTDGWVKKQLTGEKKGWFSTVVPCFSGVLHGKMWTRAEEANENALVAT